MATSSPRTDSFSFAPDRKMPRPANSVLDCGKIAATYGIAQPDWRASLDAVIGELAEAEA